MNSKELAAKWINTATTDQELINKLGISAHTNNAPALAALASAINVTAQIAIAINLGRIADALEKELK